MKLLYYMFLLNGMYVHTLTQCTLYVNTVFERKPS